MTTPQQKDTQTEEEHNARILSTFVHIENVNGPQRIFNGGVFLKCKLLSRNDVNELIMIDQVELINKIIQMIKNLYGIAGVAKSELSLISLDSNTNHFILYLDGFHQHFVSSSLPLISSSYSVNQSVHPYSIEIIDKSPILALLF